jgi:hypothetical protein
VESSFAITGRLCESPATEQEFNGLMDFLEYDCKLTESASYFQCSVLIYPNY